MQFHELNHRRWLQPAEEWTARGRGAQIKFASALDLGGHWVVVFLCTFMILYSYMMHYGSLWFLFVWLLTPLMWVIKESNFVMDWKRYSAAFKWWQQVSFVARVMLAFECVFWFHLCLQTYTDLLLFFQAFSDTWTVARHSNTQNVWRLTGATQSASIVVLP